MNKETAEVLQNLIFVIGTVALFWALAGFPAFWRKD